MFVFTWWVGRYPLCTYTHISPDTQHEQQRVVELERLNTFKLMLEKEQQFVETKRADLARGYNPAVAVELASAEKRVRELQQKYNQMANRLGLPTSESQPLVQSSSFI